MSGDLYDDPLAWSERQAALLRRLAGGERLNEAVDWANVIEEIESLGRSELQAVRSPLSRALERLLKIHGWPDGPVSHWRREARAFLADADLQVSPSMRQRLDLRDLYERARQVIAADDLDGKKPEALPDSCPFEIEDLIVSGRALPDIDLLIAKMAGAR